METPTADQSAGEQSELYCRGCDDLVGHSQPDPFATMRALDAHRARHGQDL